MGVDLKALADTAVVFIGHDNVIAYTTGKKIDLQVLLMSLKDDIDRERWLEIAAAAWDAARV